MKMKISALALAVWGVMALSSPRPAHALAAIPGLGGVTEVVVTPVSVVASTDLYCGDAAPRYHFSYLQLMTVHGFGRVWVPVEFIYPQDPNMEAGAIEECQEGDSTYYIYGLDSCGC
jgi:hypothetical protein